MILRMTNSDNSQKDPPLSPKQKPMLRAPKATSDHLADIENYCQDIISGKIPASEEVRWACERHQRDLKRKKFKFKWNPQIVCHVINWIEFCIPHTTDVWRGKALKLEPWQKFFFGSVFGWWGKDAESGLLVNRFQDVLLEVGKKNGKSLMLTAIAAYLSEFGPAKGHIISGAPKKDQAKNRLG